MSTMFKMPLRETPRELTAADLYRMRVGRAYYGTCVDDIPARCKHKKVLRTFLKNIVTNVDQGRGLFFYGGYGTGKTSCGTIILKNVVARRGTALMIRAEEIQTAVIEKTRFDDSQTLWDRMMGVDCLLVDDLTRAHVKEWGKSKIEGLIRRRVEERRSVILTVNIAETQLEQFTKRNRSMIEALREVCEIVPVAGVNWRAKIEGER